MTQSERSDGDQSVTNGLGDRYRDGQSGQHGAGQRRVVVTGVGLMTSLGVGRDATWRALLAGENGIGPVTLCDSSDLESKIAGEVHGFDPLDWIEKKGARRMDRFVQLSIAATQDALDHSQLDVASAPDEIGTMIGSGMGGLTWLEEHWFIHT